MYLDEGGVLSTAKPGTIIVEMSTISADLSLEIHRGAEKRVFALSTCRSPGGGRLRWRQEPSHFLRVRTATLYESIDKQWFLIGPGASGVEMKLVVEPASGSRDAGLAEAISN